jgi:hypothetical protein
MLNLTKFFKKLKLFYGKVKAEKIFNFNFGLGFNFVFVDFWVLFT